LIYRIGYWDSNPLLLDILNWLLGFQPSTSWYIKLVIGIPTLSFLIY
jgi:hypothetical protein